MGPLIISITTLSLPVLWPSKKKKRKRHLHVDVDQTTSVPSGPTVSHCKTLMMCDRPACLSVTSTSCSEREKLHERVRDRDLKVLYFSI